MNIIFFKDQKFDNYKNWNFIFYSFPICLYLPMMFTNILTMLMAIFIITNFRKINYIEFFKKKYVLFFFGMYFLIFLGFFYDISEKGIFSDLEKKLSFIVIPIALFLSKKITISLKKILASLFFSGFIFSSLAFLISLVNVIKSSDYDKLIHHNFSESIGLHATYLSMYLFFSLSFPFFYINTFLNTTKKRLIILLSIIIGFYILLLSVRIVWISLLIILLFFLIKIILRKKIKTIRYLILIILISSSFIYFFSPLNERLKEVVNYNGKYNVSESWSPNAKEVWGGRGIRILIWESCLELFEKKPLLGYGSSKEVQKRLDKYYFVNEIGPLLFLMDNRGKTFNPHNQYFLEFLKFGLLFGSLFIFMIIYLFFSSLKNKNFLAAYCIFIIGMISLTETVFELNKGIVFCSFFLPLVFCNQNNNKTN